MYVAPGRRPSLPMHSALHGEAALTPGGHQARVRNLATAMDRFAFLLDRVMRHTAGDCSPLVEDKDIEQQAAALMRACP